MVYDGFVLLCYGRFAIFGGIILIMVQVLCISPKK